MARGVNTKANGIDFRANRFDEFLKLIPQNLTDAEKAQVLANLGITPTPGSLDGAVRYDAAQTLNDQQKAKARTNIGAKGAELETFEQDLSVITDIGYISKNGVFKASSNVRYRIYDISDVDTIEIVAKPDAGTNIAFLEDVVLDNNVPANFSTGGRIPILSGETYRIARDSASFTFKYLYVYLSGSGDSILYVPEKVIFGKYTDGIKEKHAIQWHSDKGKYINISGKIKSSSDSSTNSYQIQFCNVKKGDVVNFIAYPTFSPYGLSGYVGNVCYGFIHNGYSIDDDLDKFIRYIRKGDAKTIIKGSHTAPYDGMFCVYYPIQYGLPAYDVADSNIEHTKRDIGIGIVQGRVENGCEDGDLRYCTSDFIEGGGYFHLEMRDGFRVSSAHLYNDNYELICPNFIGEGAYQGLIANYRKSLGFYLPSHMKLRVTAVRNSNDANPSVPEGKCLVEDCPFWKVTYLDDKNSTYMSADDQSAYKYVKHRAFTLASVISAYARTVPNYKSSGNEYALGNEYWNIANHKCLGVSYSDSRELASVVGQDVSIFTYLSAIRNKYSVAYTEKRNNNGYSLYGLNLSHRYRLALQYFEMACNMFWGYCFGMKAFKLSGSAVSTGYNKIYDANPSSEYHHEGMFSDYIHPLDTLVHDGHLLFVVDVITKDNDKYIVTAESTTPFTRITVFKSSEFDAYYMSNSGTESTPNYYKSYRKTSAYDISSFCQPFDIYNESLVARKAGEYPYYGSHEDCVMYIGNRCSIKVGDPVFVNVNRNTDRFTKVNIYKDATYLNSIDITELTQWANDPDGEDWVKVDLSSVCTEYGKYRVYASNADETDVSNDALFELIDLTLSKSGNTATFSVSGGIPYVIQEEVGTSGFMHGKYIELDEDDTSCDVSTFTNVTDDKIALYAMGDYGCVKTTVSKS